MISTPTAIPLSTAAPPRPLSSEIARTAVENGYFATRSHAADPILCAAGEESLNITVDEDLPARAAHIEQRIRDAFAAMAEDFELIGDVRGRGVLLGIELVTDRDRKTPADAQAEQVFAKCFDDGLIFQIRGARGLRNVIRLVPPMTTTDDEVDRAMSIIHDAIKSVAGSGT